MPHVAFASFHPPQQVKSDDSFQLAERTSNPFGFDSSILAQLTAGTSRADAIEFLSELRDVAGLAAAN